MSDNFIQNELTLYKVFMIYDYGWKHVYMFMFSRVLMCYDDYLLDVETQAPYECDINQKRRAAENQTKILRDYQGIDVLDLWLKWWI